MDYRPQYLLIVDDSVDAEQGAWRLELRNAEGRTILRAADIEPHDRGERVELLAVLRGLEALDEPARVIVVTNSRYVRRGMAYGLDAWRRNGWTWEAFGRMAPIKNRDLWQRLDRARQVHHIICRPPQQRQFRVDQAEDVAARRPRSWHERLRRLLGQPESRGTGEAGPRGERTAPSPRNASRLRERNMQTA